MSLDIDVLFRRRDFDLDLRFRSEARTIGIIGPSGSGKTTLLNLIAGTLAPIRGHVIVSGRVFADTGRNVLEPPHRRHLGYVFQDGRLFPHLTVRQNLQFARWFSKGRQPAVAPERIVEILGIRHLLHRRAVGLSGGEQQRVAIGRALFASPRLLLMDEPLASLDASHRREILPLIERVRDESRIPLVYVSHVGDEIRYLADEVIRIEQGRLTEQRANLTRHEPSVSNPESSEPLPVREEPASDRSRGSKRTAASGRGSGQPA